MTGTSCRARLRAVAFGNMRSAPRMRRRLAGPMSVAHEPAKVQAVIVRNFSPALPGLMLSDNTVETLPTSIGQQVRVLQ